MIKNFVKYSLLLVMRIFIKTTLLLLRGNHRKCVWTILLLTVTIIYLVSKCDLLNRTNCGVNINGSSDNPVIIWWTPDFPGTQGTKICAGNMKCKIFSNVKHEVPNVDAYLFYGSQIDLKDMPIRQGKHIWGLYHEESPRNIEELMHESMLSLFNFSATFSRHSDVPFPLQYIDSIDEITSTKYFVPTPVKNAYLNEIAPVMYLQSDCETSTERDAYVKELMKYIKIDSYGPCLNNKQLPKKFTEDYLNNLNEDEFLHFVARYKFLIAIENGVCEDYVTEKYWRAIKVGAVPIYFGTPTIRDWLPNEKAAILLEDFPTPEILSAHLKILLDNDTLYEEYLVHKTKQIVANKELVKEGVERPYQSDGLVTVDLFECLVCQELHTRKYVEPKLVDQSHYNCPEPVSALTLSVNPSNHWVKSWKRAKSVAAITKKRLTSF